MAPGLVGGDSRYRPPPLTMGDRGECGMGWPPGGFLPSEEEGWIVELSPSAVGSSVRLSVLLYS